MEGEEGREGEVIAGRPSDAETHAHSRLVSGSKRLYAAAGLPASRIVDVIVRGQEPDIMEDKESDESCMRTWKGIP